MINDCYDSNKVIIIHILFDSSLTTVAPSVCACVYYIPMWVYKYTCSRYLVVNCSNIILIDNAHCGSVALALFEVYIYIYHNDERRRINQLLAGVITVWSFVQLMVRVFTRRVLFAIRSQTVLYIHITY